MPLAAIFVKRHNPIHSDNNQFRAAHIAVTSDIFLEYLEARECLIGVGRCNGDGKYSSSDVIWPRKRCKTACLVTLWWAGCGAFSVNWK